MIDPNDPRPSLVQSVLHPSDFSEESERAFAHALAISLLRQTELTLFHTDSAGFASEGWERFPAIRKTLERWQLLPTDSQKSAVFRELGIRVQKVAAKDRSPTRAIIEFLTKEPAELIVLSTRGKDGMPLWFDTSVAERVARKSETMTLFVPNNGKGFVSPENGETSLNRILVAVDNEPRPNAAIAFACSAGKLMGNDSPRLTLLHVGGSSFPDIEIAPDSGCEISEVTHQGDVVDAIISQAREDDSDLIVMTTQGRRGFLDALRGSTTEQVLRRSECPVLAVPAHDD